MAANSYALTDDRIESLLSPSSGLRETYYDTATQRQAMKNKPEKIPKSARTGSQPDPNRYPKGWDRKHVEAIISHYENQTDAPGHRRR